MRYAENMDKWREVFLPAFITAKKVSFGAAEWHDEDRDCENGLIVYYNHHTKRYKVTWTGEGWGSSEHTRDFEEWIEKFYRERSDDQTQADYGPMFVKWADDMTDVWYILRETTPLEYVLDV